MKILDIDAWKGIEPGITWEWNNWFTLGHIDKIDFEKLTTNRKLLKFFRDNDYLSEKSAGKCGIDDDGYNITVIDRNNGRPLIAIEYGIEY